MAQVKQVLIHELEDLLSAETQLTQALPKMAKAARHPKLKEAFEKHLGETKMQVERLRKVFDLLGEKAGQKPCKAMMGLIKEGEEKIAEGSDKEPIGADLALIAAAQKVEHYEIASYGTSRAMARQIGEIEVAQLLSQSLGEEERADFMMTAISDPLIQQASLDDMKADVQLESNGKRGVSTKKRNGKKVA